MSRESVELLRDVGDAMSRGGGVDVLLPHLDPEVDLISTLDFLRDAYLDRNQALVRAGAGTES